MSEKFTNNPGGHSEEIIVPIIPPAHTDYKNEKNTPIEVIEGALKILENEDDDTVDGNDQNSTLQ